MTLRYVMRRPAGEAEREQLVAALWAAGSLGLWERPETGEILAWFERRTASVPPDGVWEEERERDWLAEWKAGLAPIEVGGLTVAPSWAGMEADRRTIVVDPGMAFGTGHHATTRMCLKALGRIHMEGARVLDVGTGTGILAIAAVRLGAAEVVAIDNDPDAIAVAEANLARNGVAADLRTGELDSVPHDPPFDVVVANLTTEVLVDLARGLAERTRREGRLIVSGVATERADRVLAAHDTWAVVARDDEEGWTALTLRHRAPPPSRASRSGRDFGRGAT